MVLILSEESDQSTNRVIDWLKYFQIPYKKLNKEDHIRIEYIRIQSESGSKEVMINVHGDPINYKNISAVWFRRGYFKVMLPNRQTFSGVFGYQIYKHLATEGLATNDFLHLLLEEKMCIGSRLKENPNKLKVLHLAEKSGLKIPDTLITESIEKARDFYKNEGSIITKGIQETGMFQNQQITVSHFTELVKKHHLEDTAHTFSVSLFQSQIQKLFEIRIFYLMGKFYSMAIFSQLNERTQIDFRHYDHLRPNRWVPFNLPQSICGKLDDLMKSLELNTGSIDMIYSQKKEYIFLEVNPVGQFGMVSVPCNYFLEKEIALILKTAYENEHFRKTKSKQTSSV